MIKILILSLSSFALANSVQFGKLSDLDDKLFDQAKESQYVHGVRQPGDILLEEGSIYGPMSSPIELTEIDLSELGGTKKVITYCQFVYTSGDDRSASLGVLNGGKGKDYVNVVYTSESKYIYSKYYVYGFSR